MQEKPVTRFDANAIRAAAREAVRELTGSPVSDDEPLISSGRIDSLSILKLIVLLEKKLAVSLPPGNLQPDDFENIDWIVETVERSAVSS
jgi:acyl carrier protein